MRQTCRGKEDRPGDWRARDGTGRGGSGLRRGNSGTVCGNAGATGRVAGAPSPPLRRRTSNELARFVRIAMGSASELDYHLLLCRDLDFMSGDDFTSSAAKLTEVRKMLTSFLQSVEEQIETHSRAAGKS